MARVSVGLMPLLSAAPPSVPSMDQRRDRRVHWGSLLGVSGSFGFRWFGTLLLRLNFPEFVASPSGFKALRRLFGIVPYRGQGQCPVLNLEEGSDNLADAISL